METKIEYKPYWATCEEQNFDKCILCVHYENCDRKDIVRRFNILGVMFLLSPIGFLILLVILGLI